MFNEEFGFGYIFLLVFFSPHFTIKNRISKNWEHKANGIERSSNPFKFQTITKEELYNFWMKYFIDWICDLRSFFSSLFLLSIEMKPCIWGEFKAFFLSLFRQLCVYSEAQTDAIIKWRIIQNKCTMHTLQRFDSIFISIFSSSQYSQKSEKDWNYSECAPMSTLLWNVYFSFLKINRSAQALNAHNGFFERRKYYYIELKTENFAGIEYIYWTCQHEEWSSQSKIDKKTEWQSRKMTTFG